MEFDQIRGLYESVMSHACHGLFFREGQAFGEIITKIAKTDEGFKPLGWEEALDGIFDGQTKPTPPRQAGGVVLQALSSAVPFLIGGAADLGPSTKTIMRGEDDFSAATPHGRNMHFGVREHAMAAAANGMALHGGLIPYAATYLVFADYLRPSLRLAAMMGLKVV